MADELVVSGIELDARDVLRQIRRVDRQLNRLEDQVDDVTASTERAEKTFGGFGKAVAGAAAAFGAFRAAERAGRFIFETNRQFQQLEARLTSVTGSVEDAESAFQLITDFASETPFQIQNLVEAFTQLQLRGLEPTAGTLRDLGNFAAAFGRDVTDFVQAILRAAEGGTERLRESFGIPIEKQGDQIAVTFRGTRRVVDAEVGAMVELFRELGRENFADAMSRQMDTLVGSLSNLEDTAAVAARKVGEEGLNEAIQDLAGTIEDAITRNDEFAKSLGENLARGVRVSTSALELLLEHTDAIIRSLEVLAGIGLARGLAGLAARLGTVAAGASGVGAALLGLAGGPLGAVVTLAGAIGGPLLFNLLSAKDEAASFREEIERAGDAAEDLGPEAIRSELERLRAREQQLVARGERFARSRNAAPEGTGLRANFENQLERTRAQTQAVRAEIVALEDALASTTEQQEETTESTERQNDAVEKLIRSLQGEVDQLKLSEAELLVKKLITEEATAAEIQRALVLLQEKQALEKQAEAEEEARKEKEKMIEALERQMQSRRENIRQIEREAQERVDQLVSQVRLSRIQEQERQANEAAENISRALTDPLVDVISQTESVIDAFENMVDGIIRELLRLTVQRGISSLLSGFLSGFFGGGIPDAPDTSGINPSAPDIPGFASGGSFEVGGSGGIDSQLVAFRATPGERVDVTPPGRGQGGEIRNVNSRVEVTVVANDTRGFDELLKTRQQMLVGLVRQGIEQGM